MPVLIDPAVFYGDREQDIAISQLFGGFRLGFLESYPCNYLLEEDWEKRLSVYQLYYLLAHLNMLSESYSSQVEQLLDKR